MFMAVIFYGIRNSISCVSSVPEEPTIYDRKVRWRGELSGIPVLHLTRLSIRSTRRTQPDLSREFLKSLRPTWPPGEMVRYTLPKVIQEFSTDFRWLS